MTLRELEPPERKRLARSAGAGAAFWIVTTVVLAFVPVTRKPFPEPDYPPVYLTLTSPVTAPARERQAAAQPVPAEAPATDSSARAAQNPAKPAGTAATPAKPASAAAKPAPAKAPQSAPSSGLGIPDFDVPVTSSNVNSGDAEFLDFSSNRQTQSPTVSSVPPGGTPTAELQGSAATATTGKTGGANVSSKTASGTSTGSATAETSAALKGVEGAASGPAVSVAESSSGAASSYATTTTTSAGRVSSVAGLSFEGQNRTLISPKDPRIILTEPLAKLIDSNRDVTVRFRVLPDGSVPRSSIRFDPSGTLPDKIQEYLKDQFERWRFEKANESGQASFSYSIKLE